jgi:hypothetical protein
MPSKSMINAVLAALIALAIWELVGAGLVARVSSRA